MCYLNSVNKPRHFYSTFNIVLNKEYVNSRKYFFLFYPRMKVGNFAEKFITRIGGVKIKF